MTYSLEILTPAQKNMAKFPRRDSENLKEKILQLSKDPRPRWTKKLKGHGDAFRIAVGNYRVVYTINETKQLVTILGIDDRKDVYKKQ